MGEPEDNDDFAAVMITTEARRAGAQLGEFNTLSTTFFTFLKRIGAEQATTSNIVPFPTPSKNTSQERDTQLPNPEEIVVSHDFVRGHFLEDLILKPGRLSVEELLGVLQNPQIDLTIEWFTSGIVPASRNRDSSYFSHTWLRDAAYVALAMGLMGDHAAAQKIMTKLAHIYGSKGMREWLLKFTEDSPSSPFLYQAHEDIPWVRFIVDPESGEIIPQKYTGNGTVEHAKDWAHTQLDAHGLFGFVAARLARLGVINIQEIDRSIQEKNRSEYGDSIPSQRYEESIFALNLRFLSKIGCFCTKDHGPWENKSEFRRATSIGMCLGAFYETQRLLRSSPSEMPFAVKAPAHYRGTKERYFKNLVDACVLEGTGALRLLVPDDPNGYAMECDEPGKEANVSLAFLLYPLDLPLTPYQKGSIHRQLATLRREVAHIRYPKDNFNGKNYHSSGLPHEAADITQSEYTEAEWPLIDAFLACGFYRDYEDSNGEDPTLHELGERYARRALAAITKKEYRYPHRAENQEVHIPQGACPELWTKIDGEYKPGKNSPLLWYECAVAMMLGRAIRAGMLNDLREEFFPAQESVG